MTETTLDLYRAVRKAGAFKKTLTTGTGAEMKAKTGVLYPDFESKSYFNKKLNRTVTRPPDVKYDKNDEVVPGGGTSLFDKEGVFGTGAWRYFHIPEGTVVPDSLAVRYTHFNKTYQADHYQIEVAGGQTLPVDSMCGALDNLARNAIVKQCENAGVI